MCPRSINLMKISVTCLFWPWLRFTVRVRFPSTHRNFTFHVCFFILLFSFCLTWILFHPSCVTLFLLLSYSISVLILVWFIPLSPPMPVSYLIVIASMSPYTLNFCLHHCLQISVSASVCLSVCLHLLSTHLWLVALPCLWLENKQIMCLLMDVADERWILGVWEDQGGKTKDMPFTESLGCSISFLPTLGPPVKEGSNG